MYLYELSKQDLKLSKAEVVLMGKLGAGRSVENYLFVNKKLEYSRLAYTKKVYRLLLTTTITNLKEKLKEYDFNKIYSKSFSLNLVHNHAHQVGELADLIYRKIRKPKVDLKHARTKIEIIFLGKKAYVCLLLWENYEDFNSRKAHKRPKLHPSSLDPRLARAMVNMASSDEILDPFCGSGGILIETGLMGLRSIGYDIDSLMLNRARMNLKHFKVKKCRLMLGDATSIKGHFKAIVTDPPYSKNTKDVQLEKLYFDFLMNAESLTRKVVICFPDFMDYKRILRKTRWNIIEHFYYYLHKSLAKDILVLERI